MAKVSQLKTALQQYLMENSTPLVWACALLVDRWNIMARKQLKVAVPYLTFRPTRSTLFVFPEEGQTTLTPTLS